MQRTSHIYKILRWDSLQLFHVGVWVTNLLLFLSGGKYRMPALICAGCHSFSGHLKEGDLIWSCLDTIAKWTLFYQICPFKLFFICSCIWKQNFLIQWGDGLGRSDVLCCMTKREYKMRRTLTNLPDFVKYTPAPAAIFTLHQQLRHQRPCFTGLLQTLKPVINARMLDCSLLSA